VARLTTCPELFFSDVRSRYLGQLTAVLPLGLDRVFLCNSGTEAIEAAIKLARLATGRTEILATMRGFHGRTLGALSATWEARYRTPFEPLVPGFSHVRYNDFEVLAAALSEHTAAVLIEVVQGEGGVRVGDVGYLQRVAHLCEERGVLLIVDEVQTGFGRTGRLWACEHAGIVPDLLCLAKSMASGIPMGATCLGSHVPSFPPGAHSSTFGGNPLACAAASATLAELLERHLSERAAELGLYLLERLRAVAEKSPVVREVRGLGLMVGIELRTRVQPFLDALAERGVLALSAGPRVVRLLPPLVIDQAQIDSAIAALEEVLA
jgi:acetylornithine/LysW-gamma-L-lysine aminotransferase